MAAGDYIRFFKASKMLAAGQRLIDIESSSFHAFKDEHREKIIRTLNRAAKHWLFEPVKDFAEVAANFAKRLNENG